LSTAICISARSLENAGKAEIKNLARDCEAVALGIVVDCSGAVSIFMVKGSSSRIDTSADSGGGTVKPFHAS
jgi:hypothetical protein